MTTTLTPHTSNKPMTRRRIPSKRVVVDIWPIRNAKDYDAAVKVVSDLATYPEGSLSPENQARLDIFSDLIEAYDNIHCAGFFRELTVLERLRNLVTEHERSESDFGRLLGNRQAGHDILSGNRPLSKRHISILAKHFCLPADAFFD
ncbi:TPA: hypothetical protein DDW35_02305 [Candidatus Sumerlaeota bacterium]|nr:hypothetical protein [Candidatus Sumerlaeota bacterium]